MGSAYIFLKTRYLLNNFVSFIIFASSSNHLHSSHV